MRRAALLMCFGAACGETATGTPPGGNDNSGTAVLERVANTTCFLNGTPPAGVETVTVDTLGSAQGFTDAVQVVSAPGDADHIYIVRKSGLIQRVPNSRTATDGDVETFLSV